MERKEIIIVDCYEKEIELGHRAEEVDVLVQNAEIRKIIANIKAIMKEKNLTSLSAPVIGYNKRIFCIKFDGDIKAFINPIIVQPQGLQLSKEVCISIPGKTYILPRNNDITVMYQKATGTAETQQMVGMAAFVFQHELNHLDGLLISDFGAEVPENYDEWSDEDKQEFIDAYLDTLDLKHKEIHEEIEANSELKELHDGINFMESVVRGDVKLATKEDMGEK